MRRSDFSVRAKGARLAPLLLVLAALTASLLPTSHARQVEGRPRRVGNAAAAAPPQSTAQPRQTPTPKPTPPPGPAITIQDAPPPPPAPPKLRTQPVAEPDAPQQDESGQAVDPDEVVKIDTSLVNLHVRVVDRNNRPINDVQHRGVPRLRERRPAADSVREPRGGAHHLRPRRRQLRESSQPDRAGRRGRQDHRRRQQAGRRGVRRPLHRLRRD